MFLTQKEIGDIGHKIVLLAAAREVDDEDEICALEADILEIARNAAWRINNE